MAEARTAFDASAASGISQVNAIPLSNHTLGMLPEGIRTPTYDRSKLKHGIVHMGTGEFARAHLFEYVEDLVEQGHMDLGITAVCPNNTHLRDVLAPQDNLYTLRSRSQHTNQDRVIGCIKDVMVARENRQAVVDLIASPETKYVTLTITLKGYHYDNNNLLNLASPDIQTSLAKADEPTTAVAYIVEAMALRMKLEGAPGISIISCDNVVNNGVNLKGAVLAYANERAKARNNGVLDDEGKKLAKWIEANVHFPNTMVDRITPSYKPQHTEALAQDHGVHDNAPVKSEAVKQFVIDKDYADVLPPFNAVGAEYVERVAPFDRAKNRLLNGAHMVMGLVGRLSGRTYANEVMEDPDLKKFVVGAMNEVRMTLSSAPGLDLEAYQASLLDRFSNPYMKDELIRLARNGEQKLGRILDPLKELHGDLRQYPFLTTAAAAWVSYLKNADSSHKVAGDFPIEAPGSYEKGYVEKAKALNGHIAPFLANEEIWGSLRQKEGFHEAMQAGWERVGNSGPQNKPGLDFKPQ